MKARLTQTAVYQLRPRMIKELTGLGELDKNTNITSVIKHLVRLRVSQINGCCFCIHMHTQEARDDGIAQVRLDVLSTWREAPCYSKQEQAALNWAETLTNIARTGDTDLTYKEALSEFGETGLLDLTAIILQINSWNRIAIGFAFSPNIVVED